MLRVLLVHHTPYHFEIAMAFDAHLRGHHKVALWSNALERCLRWQYVAERGVTLFDSSAEYDVLVLISADAPLNNIPEEITALLQTKPVVGIDHDFRFQLSFGRLFLYPGAPFATTPSSVGFDYSKSRLPLSAGSCKFLVQGDIGPRRAYWKMQNILQSHQSIEFNIVGAPPGKKDESILPSTVTSDRRVHFHPNLPELGFYQAAAANHFILPLIDPIGFPRYFESALTSSALVGFSQSIPFIAHRKLFELYPLVGFAYETDDELLSCVGEAISLEQQAYDKMVERLRLIRESMAATFITHFDMAIGRLGLPMDRFPFTTFQELLWQHGLEWDSTKDHLSVPGNMLGRLLAPILGWYPDDMLSKEKIEIPMSRLATILRPALTQIAVDDIWYRSRYLANRTDKVDPKTHFMSEGYFRGHLPRPVALDEAYYLQSNPDVAAAIIAGGQPSAQSHFEAHGFCERRRPHPGWLNGDLYHPPALSAKIASAAMSEKIRIEPLCRIEVDALCAKSSPSKKSWRDLELSHLKRFFDDFKIDCVFDVGANAGQYAECIRNEIGFKGPIISFEPIPHLAALIRDKAKSDTNWHVLELALDRTVRDAVFNVMASDQFSSLKKPRNSEVSIFQSMNKIESEVQVRTSTLAIEFALLKDRVGFSRPFLKMDTQGNDLEVVEGAGHLIREFVGLQSELSIRRIYEESFFFDEVLRRYMELGFVLSAFVPNNDGHFPSLIEIDCIMYRG